MEVSDSAGILISKYLNNFTRKEILGIYSVDEEGPPPRHGSGCNAFRRYRFSISPNDDTARKKELLDQLGMIGGEGYVCEWKKVGTVFAFGER